MTATLCIVLMVVLLALSVPFWVVLGVGTVALLLTTDSLPLSLRANACSSMLSPGCTSVLSIHSRFRLPLDRLSVVIRGQ